MKFLAHCTLLFFLAVSCGDSGSNDRVKKPILSSSLVTQSNLIVSSLTFAWETDTLLTTVESVVYDPVTQFIYTANIDGHFMAKDGQGAISKVSLEGEIVDANWVAGLDAPTGLCIKDGTLYTTDIDRVLEIDIAQKKVTKIHTISGAKGLNDVTISPEGVVYASDTGANKVFRIEDGSVSELIDAIETPNGLFFWDEALLITQWTPETLSIYHPGTASIKLLAGGIAQADGVDLFGTGHFLVSSWGGQVHFVSSDGSTSRILDTSAEGKKAADVVFIPEKNMVLVATFSGNTIAAYRVDK